MIFASPIRLSTDQQALLELPLTAKIFLEGPFGSGKTTAAVQRLLSLIDQGTPAESILLLTPQRTLISPYHAALAAPGVAAGGMVSIVTLGGLARRMIELFWPVIAAPAGFAQPDQPPSFLTLETAQYYLAFLLRPLLEQGAFSSLTLARNRLYSQVIDNLNKAAVVGFPHTEIAQRLKAAWTGDPGQARVYDDAQTCANLFRDYCYAHNLLDFSLQVELFRQHLWPSSLCRNYLLSTYHHLLVENIEEDTTVTHDLLRAWLPLADSALLIYDEAAGYRRFLGANPESAYALKELCDKNLVFEHSFVTSASVTALGQSLGKSLAGALTREIAGKATTETASEAEAESVVESALDCLHFQSHRFFPMMLDWTVAQIAGLVEDGVSPGEITVLAPFLSDALRYALAHRLEQAGIPVRSHRPSRSLREESVTECLLTLALLSHPEWLQTASPLLLPTRFEIAYALVQAIADLDLVRAQLLADVAYHPAAKSGAVLASFETLNPDMQERITYLVGERYEYLRQWIETYQQSPPEELDHFLSRLFGEVLSQPGFGFQSSFSAGEITANLIESVQKFRWVAAGRLTETGKPLGLEYLEMVQDGVIAAQYIRSWELQVEQAVLLAPAYTFLMSNRPVDYQFWLDTGSRGWSERLYQPLTHPYVLSRNWPEGHLWSDGDEVTASQEALRRLAVGLLLRCRKGLYLGLSELGEQGFEQRGPLLNAFQRVLRAWQWMQ